MAETGSRVKDRQSPKGDEAGGVGETSEPAALKQTDQFSGELEPVSRLAESIKQHLVVWLVGSRAWPSVRGPLVDAATPSRVPALKVMKKPKTPSLARLSPLAKGRIVGLREAGTERDDSVKQVRKKDGKSPLLKAVDKVLQRFEEDPEWDGLEDLPTITG